uniref:Ig-like domain-containing protein n=1 Tax=Elaeophora elaphi TaxID=1147741 RepID=A0A0R3RII8_9BILA
METNKIKPKVVNEMLIPRYSTTALMCEPVFTGTNSQAQWYHNGIVVANVSSTSNAVLHDGTYYTEQAIPDVGFLIITNISLEDEGDYWCRRMDNKQEGEVARIVVAFVEPFPSNSRPAFHPALARFGQHVTVHCPRTKAVPPPTYAWFLNGEPVDLSTRRIIQNSNGSLQIQQFLHQDIGVYECVVKNFAGRTSAKVYIDAIPLVSNDIFDGTIFANACQSISLSGLLWFLIGCLAASGAMLSYLVCAVLIARSNYRSRASLYPNSFFQIHPNFAPGFRKVVAPIADVHRNLRTNVAEQHNV